MVFIRCQAPLTGRGRTKHAVRIQLYTQGCPSGRAVLVVKALHDVTQSDFLVCTGIVAALFAGHYDEQHPVEIGVRDATGLERLVAACELCGINVVSGTGA